MPKFIMSNCGESFADSHPLTLTRKEGELLAMLVQRAGVTVPREILTMQIWGYGAGNRTRTLDVHIHRLRKKLGMHRGQYIETVFGIGYRFRPLDASYFNTPG